MRGYLGQFGEWFLGEREKGGGYIVMVSWSGRGSGANVGSGIVWRGTRKGDQGRREREKFETLSPSQGTCLDEGFGEG